MNLKWPQADAMPEGWRYRPDQRRPELAAPWKRVARRRRRSLLRRLGEILRRNTPRWN